jgi:transcription elongation factor Elf1
MATTFKVVLVCEDCKADTEVTEQNVGAVPDGPTKIKCGACGRRHEIDVESVFDVQHTALVLLGED